MQFETTSAEDMERLGARLAAACDSGCVLHLHGELGAGKTTLVRGFLHALGHRGAVKSPTYTLMEPYRLGGRMCFHLDLYRLGDPEELEYLGLRDLLEPGSILLVEWPERGQGFLPGPDLSLRLRYAGRGRRVDLVGASAQGERIVQRLCEADE